MNFIIYPFVFIGGQFFKDSRSKLTPSAPATTRLFAGLIAGLFGSALMIFNVQVSPEVFVDFRYFGIVVSAIYGRWLSSIFAGLIIAVFRLLWFGVNYQSLTVSIPLCLLF